MNNDLISIVVNVYNSEKYIGQCLESIINQTYKNLDILIINDGSTDKTLDIIKKFKDKRIRIINQKNMGITLSRNVAIENFIGEYVFFVDSDDYIKEDTIEHLYKIIKDNDAKIATCSTLIVYDFEPKNVIQEDDIKIISSQEFLKKILLGLECNGNIWGKLMHKDIIKNIRFENRVVSDVAVIYKMIMSIDKIVYSNQIKYFYYQHKDSIIGSKKSSWLIDYYKACLERYEYIKKEYPDFLANEICILLMIIYLNLYGKKDVIDFLKKEKIFKLYKKYYTLKIFKYDIEFKLKIKLLLFRICPWLYIKMVKMYYKLKRR